MKKLVWLAAALLAVSFLFPNGLSLPTPAPKPPTPAPVPAPADAVSADPAIVKILANAAAADKRRIGDVYAGMKAVLTRDGGKRVSTTEKFADFHANTLQLAVDHQPGKYPNLDVEIDRVFKTTVGTDDVVSSNAETLKKLLTACDIVIASTK